MSRGIKGSTNTFFPRGKQETLYFKHTPEKGGKQKWVSTGTNKPAEAQKFWSSFTKKSAKGSMGELLDLYLENHIQKKYKSKKQAQGYVDLHLRPAFGKIKISDFASRHIKNFITMKQGLKKKDGAPKYKDATINRWLEALSCGWNLGMNEKPPLCHESLNIEPHMLDEKNNVRENFLEDDQYHKMRDELPPHQQLILVIGCHLGMRKGEILNLRWEQLDFKENLIRLEKKQTKGKQARVAPIYGDLKEYLAWAFEIRNPKCPYVVQFRGEGITETKTAWNAASERAGIDLHIHDLRRTAARKMMRSGLSEKEIMKIGGWVTAAMFKRYFIVDEDQIKDAGRRLENYHRENLVANKVASGKEADRGDSSNGFILQ